jgi:hypothetical protein
MEVPCPVPLSEPWSPVGYRVVEISDEKPASPDQPPQVILAEPGSRRPEALRVPRSPIGYRVAVVADEIVPVEKPAKPKWDDERRTIVLPHRPRRRNPVELWIPLGAVACLVLLPALALMMITSSHRPVQAGGPVAIVLPQNIAAQQQEAVVPDAIRAQPVAAQPADLAPAGDDARLAKNDERPRDAAGEARPDDAPPRPRLEGDCFQTAVEFVRNPQEACRLAKADDKLTFILHLSGNFEDPGFT